MMTSSVVLVISATKLLTLSLTFLFISGCLRPFSIKEDLAQGQIIETTIVRKPSKAKKWGIVKKYDEYLEGYILGGVIDYNSKPIQGVKVVVKDSGDNIDPSFVQGITDQQGIFKIRFSLPIHWNRLDYSGTFFIESHWQIIIKDPKFKIHFNRKTGVIAYFPDRLWLPAKSDRTKNPIESDKIVPKKLPNPAKKAAPKTDDFFGDFGFE